MKQRIMFLGAASGQVPLIEAGRECGVETIVLSLNTDYPGCLIADRVYEVDIKDGDAVFRIAEKEKVAGIVSQLDFAAPIVADVSHRLNLPSIGQEIAVKFMNKYVMRLEASKIGIKVPAFAATSSMEEAFSVANEIGYPVVIKPADSTASRGIHKVKDSYEIELKFSDSIQYSDASLVTVEKFISGREYVVNSFTHDYRCVNLVIGKRDYYDIPDTFIPRGTLYCDAISASAHALEKRILQLNTRLVEGFGLKFGLAQAEYFYDETSDTIYFGEIGARCGSAPEVIPLACGVDANKLLINYISGLMPKPVIAVRPGASASIRFLLPEGTITKVEGLDTLVEIEGVYKAVLDNVEVGAQVPAIKNKGSRKGTICIFGKDGDECRSVMEEVKHVLKIEVMTKTGGIQGILW